MISPMDPRLSQNRENVIAFAKSIKPQSQSLQNLPRFGDCKDMPKDTVTFGAQSQPRFGGGLRNTAYALLASLGLMLGVSSCSEDPINPEPDPDPPGITVDPNRLTDYINENTVAYQPIEQYMHTKTTIPFAYPVEVVKPDGIWVTTDVTDPVAARVLSRDLNVTSAKANGNNLEIEFDKAAEEGFIVEFDDGAIKLNGTAMKGAIYLVTKGDKPKLVRLAFKEDGLYADPAVLATSVDPSAPDYDGFGPPDYTEAEAFDALSEVLDNKVGAGLFSADSAQVIKDLYYSEDLKNLLPDHTVRAAVLTPFGTIFGGLYDAVTSDGREMDVQFKKPPNGVIFWMNVTPSKVTLLINPERTNPKEPLIRIANGLGHEVLFHMTDNDYGLAEEMMANFADVMYHAQEILLNPDYAKQNTYLVRARNTTLYTALLSGNRIQPQIKASTGRTGSMFPNTENEAFKSIDGFEQVIKLTYPSFSYGQKTPLPDDARKVLEELTGTDLSGTQNYDEALVEIVNDAMSLFSDDEVAQIWNALQVAIKE